MKRFRYSVYFWGILLGIFLTITLLSGNILNSADSQPVVFAETVDEHFVFMPIVNKPPGPEFKIVFTSNRDQNWQMYDIYTMNMDGENVINLTNTPDVLEKHPVWSPDGTMIAYISGEIDQEEVFVMDANGSNKRNVSNSPTASERRPTWSPDSKKLAFMSDRDDQDGIRDVFVVNPDGSGLNNLTHSTDADEWSMDWSADGTKIVYLADVSLHPSSLFGHIVTMNADGSNKNTIFTSSGANETPVWTPNGSTITFKYWGACLAEINADGSNLRNCFTEPPHLDSISGFRWNSSGSKLAFTGFINGHSSYIYIYDPSTEQSTNISPDILSFSANARFDWSADNTQIVLEAYEDGNNDIFVINVDGSGYQNLTDSLDHANLWPDVSPIMLP